MTIAFVASKVQLIKRRAAESEEEWPGFRAEYVREQAIKLAVELADSVIMEASDGSVEDTNNLTAQVAKAFVDKVCIATQSALNIKAMERTKK